MMVHGAQPSTQLQKSTAQVKLLTCALAVFHRSANIQLT